MLTPKPRPVIAADHDVATCHLCKPFAATDLFVPWLLRWYKSVTRDGNRGYIVGSSLYFRPPMWNAISRRQRSEGQGLPLVRSLSFGSDFLRIDLQLILHALSTVFAKMNRAFAPATLP